MTGLYCFGNGENGELAIGAIEEEHVLQPMKVNWNEASQVVQVACGSTHTLFLTKEGRVFSCGSNSHFQLGHDLLQRRPQPITTLNNYVISGISAGNAHSLAVNEWGQLFSWGSNTQGQLGIGIETDENQLTPKIIRSLATKHVVQIATGENHNIILTKDGEIWAFGSNQHGELGLGFMSEKVAKPTWIRSLSGIPILKIACGSNSSFVISKSGTVFAFGKNTVGNLGLGDCLNRFFPTHLKSIGSIAIRQIAAGDNFTIFLSIKGGVFAAGKGSFAHGTNNNEIFPRAVVELMGSTTIQIATGQRHGIILNSKGRVATFGLGSCLGNRTGKTSSIPQPIVGPWTHINESNTAKPDMIVVKRVFAGGDRSFLYCSKVSESRPCDMRKCETNSQIFQLTLEITETLKNAPTDETINLDILTALEIIFRSQSCLNGSFLLTNNDEHMNCNSKNPGLDIVAASKAFEDIQKTKNESVKELIWDSLVELIKTLGSAPPHVEAIRIYLLLPLYHEFKNSKNYVKLHIPFCRAVLKLDKNPATIIKRWYGLQCREYFEHLILNYKNVVSYIINHQIMKKVSPAAPNEKHLVEFDPDLVHALNFLAFCYNINFAERNDKVPYDLFHLSEISEHLDVKKDYVNWIMDKDTRNFHLCNYPFLFDAVGKTALLQTDQAIQMHHAMQSAANQGLMSFFFGGTPAVQQFIVLNVNRETIVEDTIRELAQYNPSDLKKPLKIKFCGEEAEDAGGVRKEFFILLSKEILDPKYGMFTHYEETRQVWFSEDSFETEGMYTLIGILMGLVIYNFTIINLPFPLVLYKKILKEPVDLSDLKKLTPVFSNSLQNLLDYEDDDITDTFGLTFEITREAYGEIKTISLKPNGDKISVTQENKKEFVELYVDYILNKSVESSFNGFYSGFMRVCNNRVLELFRASELQELLIGNEQYDWYIFETEAEYKSGYTSSDQTIRWFWEVFHEFSLEDKKSFLLFLTGSDRVPIVGMKALKIFIQPTHDDKCLPVAHTCFNLLDLPRYRTKERLKYKLSQSIQQTQGFSLV